jgi:hypothetical protein
MCSPIDPRAWLADVLARSSDHPALLDYSGCRHGSGRGTSGLLSRPDDGASSYVFTITRVAKLLSEPEELVQDIAVYTEPEDGYLSVLDVDDVLTVALQ